jgi:hypothetical protein
MMPELKALFDSPRLWPGKGARMQGYGDKQTISGVTAPGANGVYTLGRSEKSGLTPQLSTAEQPVELRAGPGVRLHGYGGIHTLERLPVEEEEPPVEDKAALLLEKEILVGKSRICFLANYPGQEGKFVIAAKLTTVGEFGSYYVEVSKSGEIKSWGGDAPEPAACGEETVDTNIDDDFEYGPTESQTQSYTTVSDSRLYSPARSRMAISKIASGKSNLGFFKGDWEKYSTEVVPFGFTIGSAFCTEPNGAPVYQPSGYLTIQQVRYRFFNKGNVALRINHGFYGSGQPGGERDEEFDTTLYPNFSSGWFDSNIPSSDPRKSKTAIFKRIRIGRYLLVP